MKRRLILRRQAGSDLRQAFDWYEQQRPGLGVEFVTEVERAIQSLSGRPNSFPKTHGDARRILVNRFPYGVYFVVGARSVSVIGVLHGSRNIDVIVSKRL
jgi:plasmid stabilization system protein ParE